MPWRARADVGLSLLALVLSAGIVVSCVSVTTSAAPASSAGHGDPPTPAASPSNAAEVAAEALPRSAEAPTDTLIAASEDRATPTPSSSGAAAPPAVPAAGSATETTAPADAGSLGSSPSLASIAPTDQEPVTPLPASASADASRPVEEVPPVEDTPPAEPTAPQATPPSTASASSIQEPPSATPAAEPTGGLDRRTVRRIQRILDRTTSRKGVAGLQVAVRLADGRTWLGSAGSASFSPQRPVRDDTVFSIASVSKTFIAALILDLAEEGKLDLDAPYGRYVPDGPRREHVTIRELLSHTSGIYDYFENPRYQRAATAWLRTRPQPGQSSRDHVWTYDEIMDLVKPGPYCKPGRCYRYSNTNYILLGRVAEAVGGAPLDRLLRRRFFRPLGLDDTYFQPADVPPPSAAHGHWPNGSGFTDHTRADPLRPFTAAVTVAGAAGAIASTARDLSVWAQALYAGRILSRASLAALTDIQPEGTYGLGTDYAVFAGRRAYGHRGGLRGFEASMWYFPDEGVSIALLSNEGNWFLSRARSIDIPMEGIAKAVLGRRR